jgi:hypothetical protein
VTRAALVWNWLLLAIYVLNPTLTRCAYPLEGHFRWDTLALAAVFAITLLALKVRPPSALLLIGAALANFWLLWREFGYRSLFSTGEAPGIFSSLLLVLIPCALNVIVLHAVWRGRTRGASG